MLRQFPSSNRVKDLEKFQFLTTKIPVYGHPHTRISNRHQQVYLTVNRS